MACMTPDLALRVALRSMSKTFRWGLRTDCTCACVAFASLHHVDPLGGCVDRYENAITACRILRRSGGYAQWCRNNIKLPSIAVPASGDLALIESSDCIGAAMALCIQPGEFAAKTHTGLKIVPAKSLEAWTCPLYLR
jgi:hypothetical protein